MIQFNVLSGKQAGALIVARRFPFRVGRDPGADARLVEPGVWENHLQLHLRPSEGLVAEANPAAGLRVNGQPADRVRLRNGDIVELGSVQLMFGFCGTRQKRFRLREGLTWVAIAALCGLQLALVYWMLP